MSTSVQYFLLLCLIIYHFFRDTYRHLLPRPRIGHLHKNKGKSRLVIDEIEREQAPVYESAIHRRTTKTRRRPILILLFFITPYRFAPHCTPAPKTSPGEED